MDDIITLVSQNFGAQSAAFVLLLLLLNPVITGLLQLRDGLTSIFSIRTNYTNEKQRLELVKLYYEIEAIKKEHGLESIQLATLKGEIDPNDYLVNEVPVIIKPAGKPQDWIDILVLIAMSIVGLFVAAIALIWSFGWSIPAYLLILAFVFSAAVLSTMIQYIKVSSKGIRFVRLLGSPKFLTWAEIETIEPVKRKEILVKGWMAFPPLPTSMTSKGYYKIHWKDGYCYYPPSDITKFHEVVIDKLNRN